MTRDEWDQIVAMMVATWPQFPPEDASIGKWFHDLEQVPAAQVHVAIETINRDGERYPPNSGAILKRVAELTHDDPDHGEAWALLNEVRWKYGIYGGKGGRPGDSVALAELYALSPPTAEAAAAIGWRELCTSPTDQEGTLRAQFRDIYRSCANRRRRSVAYKGLPAAGFAALADGGTRRRGLRKLDPGLVTRSKQLPENVEDDR